MRAAPATVTARALCHFYGMITLTCQRATKRRLANAQAHRITCYHSVRRISVTVSRLSRFYHVNCRSGLSVFMLFFIHASTPASLGKHAP